MSTPTNKALAAARSTELQEVDDGFRLAGMPEESVTTQIDAGRIPESDVTQEMLSASGDDPESWLMYGGSYEQTRYTTADVITPDNVDQLELEYELNVGTGSSMEGTPTVVPGDPPIMYHTCGPNVVNAIDAREGELLWTHSYSNPRDLMLCCDDNNRGVAVYGDTVYQTTLDAGLEALDRYTGEQRWHVSVADHKAGHSLTPAPVVYDDRVIVGSCGGEYGVVGYQAAFDPETGEELWRGEQVQEDEWVGESSEQGCGTSWMTATIDEERGMMFGPVGNPGPDFDGTVRPGPNFVTCGTIARDLDGGEFSWGHQESPHDVWDYDVSSPRMLARDVEVDGEERDLVVGGGKTGWAYMFDPDTGQVVERSEALCQHANMWEQVPHISDEPRGFIPGAPGGVDWHPGTYSESTGLAYFKLLNTCQDLFWRFEEFEAGQPYWGGGLADPSQDEEVLEEWNGNAGSVCAVDPSTGEVVWQNWIDSDYYPWGGTLSTASGLMMTGLPTGKFVAYDGENGDRLWEYDTDAPVAGDPMSWYDPETEKQYMAASVGGSGWLKAGPRSDRLMVWSLDA